MISLLCSKHINSFFIAIIQVNFKLQLTFKLGISETISVNKLCLDLPKIITTFKLLPVEFERMRKKNYITTTFQSKLQSTVVKNKEN